MKREDLKVGIKLQAKEEFKKIYNIPNFIYTVDTIGETYTVDTMGEIVVHTTISTKDSVLMGKGITTMEEIIKYFEIYSEVDHIEGVKKYIISKKAVIVFLEDGSKGVAKCHPDDTFDANKGYKLAHARAKMNQLEKDFRHYHSLASIIASQDDAW